MTAVLRVALLTVLAASSIPAIAAAQGTSIDSLNRRVVLLEGQVADLEQRMRALEALVKGEPSREKPVPASANWRDKANWRQLGRGMKMDAVRSLLGDPASVNTYPSWTMWRYPNGGSVDFNSDNKVQGWSEPPR